MLSAGSGIFCGGMHGRSESDTAVDFQHIWNGAVFASAGNGKIHDGAVGYRSSDKNGGVGI